MTRTISFRRSALALVLALAGTLATTTYAQNVLTAAKVAQGPKLEASRRTLPGVRRVS